MICDICFSARKASTAKCWPHTFLIICSQKCASPGTSSWSEVVRLEYQHAKLLDTYWVLHMPYSNVKACGSFVCVIVMDENREKTVLKLQHSIFSCIEL